MPHQDDNFFRANVTLAWSRRRGRVRREALTVDGVLYREVIRLRQENDALRRAVSELARRRLMEQQRNIIRTSIAPLLD